MVVILQNNRIWRYDVLGEVSKPENPCFVDYVGRNDTTNRVTRG